MKKGLLILTAALTFGSMAAAQTTATSSAPQVPALTDVPAGHWAKDAIDKLVSRGIILGYPDGTFRGTQNLTRYEAAVIIARLLDQMRSGEVAVDGIDQEVLTALQNAVQELAADLAALGVRVTDLEENMVSKEDFARLEERVNALGAVEGDPTALQGITDQLAALNTSVDELTANYDTLRADVDDNASNIAALNDLTVLLNQDILDLQDRVSAVEAAQSDFVLRADFDNLTNRVAGIDTRVTNLEKAPKFSVSGGFSGTFGRLNLVQGTVGFDVDRLTANTPQSASNGGFRDGDVTTVDTGKDYNTGSLTFGVKASQLGTIGGVVTVNDAYLNFGVGNFWDINAGDVYVTLDSAGVSGTLAGQKFSADYSAYSSNFKFQDYLFNNSDDNETRRGIVFNLAAASLPGAPDLTVVLGNTNSPYMTNGLDSANYYGVRMAYKPAAGTFGVSAAIVEGNRTGFGTDFNVKFGVLNLKGEGVLSFPNTGRLATLGQFPNIQTDADAAGYLEARADLGIVKFGANARAINPAFAPSDSAFTVGLPQDNTPANAGMSDTPYLAVNGVNTLPYVPNQIGFGAALGTTVGPVALGAYGDTRTDWWGNGRITGFGVKAGAQISALQLVAFYNSLTINGVAADGANGAYTGSSQYIGASGVGMGISAVPFTMTSSFGAQVSHSGTAANALVKNLNLTLGDVYFTVSKTNRFYVYGDYSATLGGFTVAPMFHYSILTNADTTAYAQNQNTVKYGIKLASPELTSVPFSPSMYLNVANRITNADTAFGVNNNGTTKTELLGQVGISLNNVVVPGASVKLGYAYYQGFGVNSSNGGIAPVMIGSANNAFNAASPYLYGSNATGNDSAKMDGVYTQIGWNGLTANYGVFRYYDLNAPAANGAPTSVAQGFKVGYSFKF
ncbi:S-layer homology domain-containing protein [Deinococcus ficus]|uniref:S-layer homology domain-containing protein n=1 Tax=Deinococcus ficus TaxID=317577 RepID=UPI0017484DC9|nr:S-layer homology domain-containing protein [Deinococcus ficus]GHF85820.1 S-layer protein [Deinococcus ficus]